MSPRPFNPYPASAQPEPLFRKILYERHPYPDNYSGKEFLDGLRLNVALKTYTLKEAVLGSTRVTTQINCVLCYCCVFVYVFVGRLSTLGLGALCLLSAASCILPVLAIRRAAHRVPGVGHVLPDLPTATRLVLIYVFYNWLVSPVFKSLTETISSDTIYATATCMFLVHLAFHDYGVDVAIVSPALSLNAAIFGTVCLISRLYSFVDVFLLLCLATEVFAIWPLLVDSLRHRFGDASSLAVTLCLLPIVTTMLLSISLVILLLYVAVFLFIILVCPAWITRMQRLKRTRLVQLAMAERSLTVAQTEVS